MPSTSAYAERCHGFLGWSHYQNPTQSDSLDWESFIEQPHPKRSPTGCRPLFCPRNASAGPRKSLPICRTRETLRRLVTEVHIHFQVAVIDFSWGLGATLVKPERPSVAQVLVPKAPPPSPRASLSGYSFKLLRQPSLALPL